MKSQQLQQQFLKLRSNKVFEAFVIFIIIFSALVVGAKTYNISANTLRIVAWLDNAITLLFFIEIVIRFIAEEQKRRFFFNFWNCFDTFIVVVSLIPIDNTEMALLGRLIRIFRVLRMVSIIPELRLLINSLIQAMPQLGYVLALMFIIFYIYAAIGSTFFAAINPTLWGDISISMLSLFRVMTFEDWTDIMYETMAVYSYSWLYYLSFIFLTTFAFLNMVIGIVVTSLEDEHARVKQASNKEPSLKELQQEIAELKALIIQQQTKT